MIFRIFFAFTLLFSLSANATVISHYGYSYDTSGNIVTGGGLQWLRWDATVGQSAESALATYAPQGWRMATYDEVAALLNVFIEDRVSASTFTFGSDPYGWEEVKFHSNEQQLPTAFLEMFGDTYAADGLIMGTPGTLFNQYQAAFAMYGELNPAVPLYDFVAVFDKFYDPYDLTGVSGGAARLLGSRYQPDQSYQGVGIALVRAVPLPAAGWLFASALAGLLFGRRLG